MKAVNEAAIQIIRRTIRYRRIGFILASGVLATWLGAQDAPQDLRRRVIERETETQKAQGNYTYEQTVTVEEFDSRGARSGEYQEKREVIFLPTHERTERFVGKPVSMLVRLKLTEEDFRDLREVQPFLLTKDQAFLYETKFRGEERMDDVDCWVMQVSPRQILKGQRLFDGMIWVDKHDFSIVRSEGKAVPEILTTHSENLFPRFTTLREKVDGDLRFPVMTYGDDTLPFRGGAQRMRLTIRYSKYQKFEADSKITFDK